MELEKEGEEEKEESGKEQRKRESLREDERKSFWEHEGFFCRVAIVVDRRTSIDKNKEKQTRRIKGNHVCSSVFSSSSFSSSSSSSSLSMTSKGTETRFYFILLCESPPMRRFSSSPDIDQEKKASRISNTDIKGERKRQRNEVVARRRLFLSLSLSPGLKDEPERIRFSVRVFRLLCASVVPRR